MFKELDGLNLKLSVKVEGANSLFDEIVSVEQDEAFVHDKLYDIIEKGLKVNNNKI